MPRIAPVIACVVDTGIPPDAVPINVVAPAASAQNPLTGCNRVMPIPIVLTIRPRERLRRLGVVSNRPPRRPFKSAAPFAGDHRGFTA
jgi:hypothetical protein